MRFNQLRDFNILVFEPGIFAEYMIITKVEKKFIECLVVRVLKNGTIEFRNEKASEDEWNHRSLIWSQFRLSSYKKYNFIKLIFGDIS